MAEQAPADATHKYVIPARCVKTPNDMAAWEKSQAYFDIVGFVNGISTSIQGKKLSALLESSPTAESLAAVFVELNKFLDETPPLDQPQRFGNKAYRDWYQKLLENSEAILKEALPEKFYPAIPEINAYFIESFGNPTRIDYGTGHELAFIMFLCALYKIEALTEKDNLYTGLKIFNAYLLFVRRLQLTYRMEPAGSHGVWSLDDYQFIPFIWGSAQLAVNSVIEPHQLLEENVVEKYKNDYMYIGCIDYIFKVKTGNFAEHSNQLWSISSVQTWIKINAGLVKMYQQELLHKFPVIQHVIFGSLLEFKPTKPGSTIQPARLGMLPPRRIPAPFGSAGGDAAATLSETSKSA